MHVSSDKRLVFSQPLRGPSFFGDLCAASMAAASSSSAGPAVRPSDASPAWMVALAHRIDQYKTDFEADRDKTSDADRLTGAVKFRGQGVVYEKLADLDQQELLDLRLGGSLAASFAPDRFLSYVLGRPVVVTQGRQVFRLRIDSMSKVHMSLPPCAFACGCEAVHLEHLLQSVGHASRWTCL